MSELSRFVVVVWICPECGRKETYDFGGSGHMHGSKSFVRCDGKTERIEVIPREAVGGTEEKLEDTLIAWRQAQDGLDALVEAAKPLVARLAIVKDATNGIIVNQEKLRNLEAALTTLDPTGGA